MSPILLLTGLLALAYFGSMLVGGRTIRGFGLPSGTEFLLLGVLFGPEFVGVFTRQNLASFESITVVALAWLGFVIGSHYGYTAAGRVSGRRMIAGVGLGAMSAVVAAVPAVALAWLSTDLRPRELLVFGLAVGAVSSETTRHAVRWAVQRYDAKGPLTRLIGDIVEADDAMPLLLLALLATLGSQGTSIALPFLPWSAVAANFVVGGALGATCAALFDVEPRSSQRWGILLGTGLLAVGVSVRLGLSAIAVMFVMGVAATRMAKDRGKLQDLLGATERAVMLPTLVVAGAHIQFPALLPFAPIAAVAIAARACAKILSGRLLGRAVDPNGKANASLGLGLIPAGVLSLSVALSFKLREADRLGEWVLALAALHALVGEVFGSLFLRRALRDAGEISEASVATPRPVLPVISAARVRAGQRAIRGTFGRSRPPSAPPAKRSGPPGGRT